MYLHACVNHKKREFTGTGGQSTNAIEGMWSRVKRALRLSSHRRPGDSDYAPFLAEFVWQNRVLRGKNWRDAAFEAVLQIVIEKYGAEKQKQWWAERGYDVN